MPEERRHESEDLEDYEILDSSDTLDGPPGDDPLDRGVATPERWSAAMRFGSTASEQEAGESLDQLLAEEEPDTVADEDDEPDDESWDENATDEDVDRFMSQQGADPRAGRLIEAEEDDDDGLVADDDLIAEDAGVDGGGATAEEAAVHVVDDDQ